MYEEFKKFFTLTQSSNQGSDYVCKVGVGGEVYKALESSLIADAAKNINIAGFRPGKAPIDLVKQRVGKDMDAEIKNKVAGFVFRFVREQTGTFPLGVDRVDVNFDSKGVGEVSLEFSQGIDFSDRDYLQENFNNYILDQDSDDFKLRVKSSLLEMGFYTSTEADYRASELDLLSVDLLISDAESDAEGEALEPTRHNFELILHSDPEKINESLKFMPQMLLDTRLDINNRLFGTKVGDSFILNLNLNLDKTGVDFDTDGEVEIKVCSIRRLVRYNDANLLTLEDAKDFLTKNNISTLEEATNYFENSAKNMTVKSFENLNYQSKVLQLMNRVFKNLSTYEVPKKVYERNRKKLCKIIDFTKIQVRDVDERIRNDFIHRLYIDYFANFYGIELSQEEKFKLMMDVMTRYNLDQNILSILMKDPMGVFNLAVINAISGRVFFKILNDSKVRFTDHRVSFDVLEENLKDFDHLRHYYYFQDSFNNELMATLIENQQEETDSGHVHDENCNH